MPQPRKFIKYCIAENAREAALTLLGRARKERAESPLAVRNPAYKRPNRTERVGRVFARLSKPCREELKSSEEY